jgi:hypothetical protein
MTTLVVTLMRIPMITAMGTPTPTYRPLRASSWAAW